MKIIDETTLLERAANEELTPAKIEAFVKQNMAKRDQAVRALDAYVKSAADKGKVSIAKAHGQLTESEDATYAKLYGDLCHTDASLTGQGRAAIVNAKADALKQLMEAALAEAEAMVEDFAMHHDMNRGAAARRLFEISNVYNALIEKAATLDAQRMTAVAQAMTMTTAVYHTLAVAAVQQTQAGGITLKRSNERPTHRALREHVERFAKSRGVAYEKAMAQALDEDETAQSLYRIMTEDDSRRQAGVQL